MRTIIWQTNLLLVLLTAITMLVVVLDGAHGAFYPVAGGRGGPAAGGGGGGGQQPGQVVLQQLPGGAHQQLQYSTGLLAHQSGGQQELQPGATLQGAYGIYVLGGPGGPTPEQTQEAIRGVYQEVNEFFGQPGPLLRNPNTQPILNQQRRVNPNLAPSSARELETAVVDAGIDLEGFCREIRVTFGSLAEYLRDAKLSDAQLMQLRAKMNQSQGAPPPVQDPGNDDEFEVEVDEELVDLEQFVNLVYTKYGTIQKSIPRLRTTAVKCVKDLPPAVAAGLPAQLLTSAVAVDDIVSVSEEPAVRRLQVLSKTVQDEVQKLSQMIDSTMLQLQTFFQSHPKKNMPGIPELERTIIDLRDLRAPVERMLTQTEETLAIYGKRKDMSANEVTVQMAREILSGSGTLYLPHPDDATRTAHSSGEVVCPCTVA